MQSYACEPQWIYSDCSIREIINNVRQFQSCNFMSVISSTSWTPSVVDRQHTHVRHLCRNISVDTSRHEVARGHCGRRPRHCCMSHSDELPSANALSALQHHLSRTLSLSPFRTVTRLPYLNLDLKHICSPPSMLLNCPVRQRLWSHGNMALHKFCIVFSFRVTGHRRPLTGTNL